MSLDFISQIETCKKANDKQLLRNTREQMTSNFPMNSKLWLDWIKDESIDPVYLSNLFKLATVDYLSVDIWKSFILFAIKSSSPEFDLDSIPDQMQLDSTMTIDQALEICKDAVKATSYHIARSHEIWDLYRDFELHLLKINKSSVSKIRKIYTDRLQIPHLEISSTFSEYSTFETNHDPDSYMANLSAMNIIVSKTREIVYDLADEGESISLYIEYSNHTKTLKPLNINLVSTIYERAIEIYPLESSIWDRYLSFLINKKKISSKISPICQRAIRNCNSHKIWNHYMRSKEAEGFDQVCQIYQNAGMYVCTSLNEFVPVYLEFVRISRIFDRLDESSFQFNGDPLHRIELALVNYLKPNPSNIDKINAIYESILVGNHWDSFARYNLSMGNEAKARSIYKRGVNERPYDQELKMKWLEFEQEFSSDHLYEAYDRVLGLEKIVEVEVKKSNKRGIDVDVEMSFKKQKGILFANLVVKEVKDVTIKAPKEEKEPTEKPAIESFYTVYSPLGGNMIRVTNMISPTVSNLTSKFQQFGPIIEVLVDESIPAAIIEFSNAESVRKSMSLNGNECSIQRCRPEKLVWNFETEINESKIHVSKLSKQTTKPELRELFKVFGEIKDIRIVDGKGKSCSAFIEFSNKDSASKSLTLDQSTFLGRVITVAVSNPSQKNKVNFNELFVGNLPYTATNADLVELFGKNVKNVRLLKGTAFVEFHDPESAKAGLLLTGTFVNGRMISVSYPDPNFKHRETRVDQDEFKMSFVPRTVKSRAARPAPKISLSATKEEGKTQDDFKRMMDLDK